jgi:hypothetical protein
MAALAIKRSGYAPMSGEVDGWVPVAQIAINVFVAGASFVVGIFVRNLGRARDDGQTLGEVRTLITESRSQARDMETRLSLRIASLELHRDNTATKQDLKEAVADIKERLSDVMIEVKEAKAFRNGVAPSTLRKDGD